MIHKLKLVAVAACVASTTACTVYLPIVSSTQGKAYMTQGSAMYFCDGSSGKPTCTVCEEKE